MSSALDSVIDSHTLRSVLGCFPSGVAVVTGAADGRPIGLTIQSFMALSIDPPLVLLAVARTSNSWARIAESGRLAINILGERQADVAMGFARSGGDKFESVSWRPGTATGSPLIADAIAWIEAEIWQTYDGGDHHIVAARVLDLSAIAGDRHPLLFFRSRFPRLDARHWRVLSE